MLIRTVLLTGAASVGGGGRGEGGGAAEKRGVEEGADMEAWEVVVVSRYVPQITHWIALAAIKWVVYGH